MDETVSRALYAFVEVYANSAHWRGGYKSYGTYEARKAADLVVCAVLDVKPGTVLALMNATTKPPWEYMERKRWTVATASALLDRLGRAAA